MSTNDYYAKNSKSFIENTMDLDMGDFYEKFEKHLVRGDRVLDVGCGPGRDLKYFSNKYVTEGIEPCLQLSNNARIETSCIVHECDFLSFDTKSKYDGIWACASLLHIPRVDLPEAFKKMSGMLNKKGIVYCSFKYGDFEGDRGGRYYTDANEDFIKKVVSGSGLLVLEEWITNDVRVERE